MDIAGRKQVVWVIDDSARAAQVARDALSGEFVVEVFGTAAAMTARLAAGAPGVIVLDWALPDGSGIDVCRAIRATHSEVALPIILVTARQDEDAMVEALSAGANDFVAKPYARAALLARVKSLARIRKLHHRAVEVEAQLATTLRSIGDAVISTDLQGRVRFLNAVAVELTGWSQAEAEGRPVLEVFHILQETTRQPVESPVEKVLRDGKIAGLANHTLLVRRDGTEFPIDDSAAPIRDEAGTMTGVVLVFRDISDKQRAEAEREALLADSRRAQLEAELERQKLRAVFDQSLISIAMLEGPGHTFTFANPAYRALVGNQDIVGKLLLDALPALRGQGFDTLLDRVVATGEPFVGKEVAVKLAHHAAHEWLYVNLVYQPKRDAAGRIDGVLASAVDVTEQVMARRAIEAAARAMQRSEERLRRLVESSGAGLWDVDAASGAIDADRRTYELMGVPDGHPLTVESSLATMPADDGVRVGNAVSAAIAGANGGTYFVEFRCGGRDGMPLRWIESRGAVSFDDDGQALRLRGAMIDVTARKRAELEREGLLEALSAQPMLLVSVVKGPALVYQMANAAYMARMGGREILGKPLAEALPELADQPTVTRQQQVLATGIPYVNAESSTVLDRGDGALVARHFSVVYQPIRGAGGVIDGVLTVAQDITDAVRARRELQAAEAEAKRHAEFERQLIGIVSHDLRNPLSTILLGTQVLMSGDSLAEKNLKVLIRIEAAAQRGARMVSDLLDFTQARVGGGIPLSLAAGNLHTLVRQVVEDIAMTNPGREVMIHTSGDGDGMWDLDRMSQVISNLITNALKYSPADSVVDVRSEPDAGGLTVSVHNLGAPIAPDSLGRIFQPMQRATSQLENKARSVGLGLFIVQHLVEAHGGRVAVTSTADAGTTLTFWVPRRPG